MGEEGGGGGGALGDTHGRAFPRNQLTPCRPFNPFSGGRLMQLVHTCVDANVAAAAVTSRTSVKGGGATRRWVNSQPPACVTEGLLNGPRHKICSTLFKQTHTSTQIRYAATPVSQQLDPCWHMTSLQPIMAEHRARR